jgi:hypothetical protein
MLLKSLKYFSKPEPFSFWGPVDDRSAKDIINKFFCWMLINPERKSVFLSTVPVGWLPAVWPFMM